MPVSSSTNLIKSSRSVISLVGFQGSGKTTLGKHLAKSLNCTHLEMSAIVRAIHTGLSRDELPATAHKTKTNANWLAETVHKLIESEMTNGVLVITGVREPAIHKYLIKQGIKVPSFEIKASPFVRYERLYELKKVNSAEQFLNHDLAEAEMGLRELVDAAPYAVVTTDDSDPKEISLAMKKRLKSKGII